MKLFFEDRNITTYIRAALCFTLNPTEFTGSNNFIKFLKLLYPQTPLIVEERFPLRILPHSSQVPIHTRTMARFRNMARRGLALEVSCEIICLE